MARNSQLPGMSEVHEATASVRADAVWQAQEAAYHLGPCPAEVGKAEADLRTFAHDILKLDHDKDYRCLAAFPPSSFEGYTMRIVRMDPHGIVTVESIRMPGSSDPKMAVWLLVSRGPQAHLFDQGLQTGTHLIEVYAGVGRLSDAVLANGGVSIKLGLDHGHDFRLARDRALAKQLFHRLKPKHAWFAWPCTPFCAWMKLAVLRNCDVAPRLREGRVHLRFSLNLALTQVSSGRHAHCENPLTSTAWREPVATQEFSKPAWLWTRLDQCATGLVGPQGDLHLKPTLIRTTSEAVKLALSLRCPTDHPHELVQGAATAASAMYSPRLAKLVADVVCPMTPASPPKVGALGFPTHWEGGEGQNFSTGTRVGKEDEARFAPGLQPWYQPLQRTRRAPKAVRRLRVGETTQGGGQESLPSVPSLLEGRRVQSSRVQKSSRARNRSPPFGGRLGGGMQSIEEDLD